MRIRTVEDVEQLRRGATAWAVLGAWAEHGLLDALASGPRTLDELPAHPHGLACTAPLLAHLGILDRDGDRWALSRYGAHLVQERSLPTGASRVLGNLSRIGHALLGGGPVPGPDGAPEHTVVGVRPDDPEATRGFLEMLYQGSARTAEETARWVAPRLSPGASVLDLGGGHGRYGMALVERGLCVTLFDLPLVVDLAQERHGDALSYVAGDFRTDDLGGPWDAVLMSNIAHGLSERENRALLGRLRAAVAVGGSLVVKDMFLDDLGTGPAVAAYFGVTMLQYTEGGRSYGAAEYAAWAAEAGFDRCAMVVTAAFTLLVLS